MTDRDLYYCGDFNCDGHARSNERCETIEEATETPTYHTTTFGTKDAKFMVSGNAVYVSRLDAEGNPTGEPMTLSGSLTNIEFTLPDDAEVVEWDQTLRSMTLDLSLNEVDPALLALLTGQGTPPEAVEVIDIRTRWQRFVDNHPRFTFTLDCLRRWTLDLVVDIWKWVRR